MGFLRWLFGKKEDISQKTMKHSTIGEFNTKNRLINGGHSQKNIDKLTKLGIKFNIEKTYLNGVRVGNVPNHMNRRKKSEQVSRGFLKNGKMLKLRKRLKWFQGAKDVSMVKSN